MLKLWNDVDAFVREFGQNDQALTRLAQTNPKLFALLPYSFELMLPYQKKALNATKSKVLMMGGRGIGKTRTGVQWLRKLLYTTQSDAPILLTTPTHSNLTDAIIFGPSGVMQMFPPHERPIFNSQSATITFPFSKVRVVCRTAENAVNIRGVSAQAWWWDEIAGCSEKQAFIGSDSVYGAAIHALREGDKLPWFFSTTPKPWNGLKKIAADPRFELIKATSLENKTLTREFVENVTTGLCRRDYLQETMGEILDDDGIYVKQKTIDISRKDAFVEDLDVVIALDPAATANEDSDETGIVIGGMDQNGEVYILEDLSGHYAPLEWANLVVSKWQKYLHHAQSCYIVAETNQGGDMVKTVLQSVKAHQTPAIKGVHAKRGKTLRLSPVVAQLESGAIHFPTKPLPELEYQLTTFSGEQGKADDRVDAFAYLCTELLLCEKGVERYFPGRTIR